MALPLWGQTSSRHAQTTIKCHSCQHPLTAYRACQEVVLQCSGCGQTFPFSEYVQEMDDALERFMEGVFCNRI